MLTPRDFRKPTSHPFGMLNNYSHGLQKESVLVMILGKNIEFGEWAPVTTVHEHPTMVTDGFLEEVEGEPRSYKLTKRSIGLLYAYYGKEE